MKKTNKESYNELWQLVKKHGVEVPHYDVYLDPGHKMLLSYKNMIIITTVTSHMYHLNVRYGMAHHIDIMDYLGDDVHIKGNLSDPKRFLDELIDDINNFFSDEPNPKHNFGNYGGY